MIIHSFKVNRIYHNRFNAYKSFNSTLIGIKVGIGTFDSRNNLLLV